MFSHLGSGFGVSGLASAFSQSLGFRLGAYIIRFRASACGGASKIWRSKMGLEGLSRHFF